MDHARIDWSRRTWIHATTLSSTWVAVFLSLPRSPHSSHRAHRQRILMENHSMASAALHAAYYLSRTAAAAVCHLHHRYPRRETENLSCLRIYHWIIRSRYSMVEKGEIVVASLHCHSYRCHYSALGQCYFRWIHQSSSAFALNPCCCPSHTNYYTGLRWAYATWAMCDDDWALAASYVAWDRCPWEWVARWADVHAAVVVDRRRVSWFSADDQGADHLSHDSASVVLPCLSSMVALVLALFSPACESPARIRDCPRAYNICLWEQLNNFKSLLVCCLCFAY